MSDDIANLRRLAADEIVRLRRVLAEAGERLVSTTAALAERDARIARLEEALVWCADAPMTTTLELLGEDPAPFQVAWMERQPTHYNETLDDARALTTAGAAVEGGGVE